MGKSKISSFITNKLSSEIISYLFFGIGENWLADCSRYLQIRTQLFGSHPRVCPPEPTAYTLLCMARFPEGRAREIMADTCYYVRIRTP